MSKTYSMKYYENKKSNGLCVNCGSEAIPGKVYCPTCRVTRNAYNKDYATKWRAKNVPTSRWYDLEEDCIFPNNDLLEVLVTDVDGSVYALEKDKNEDWEMILDERFHLAWRWMPKPYDKKNRRSR